MQILALSRYRILQYTCWVFKRETEKKRFDFRSAISDFHFSEEIPPEYVTRPAPLLPFLWFDKGTLWLGIYGVEYTQRGERMTCDACDVWRGIDTELFPGREPAFRERFFSKGLHPSIYTRQFFQFQSDFVIKKKRKERKWGRKKVVGIETTFVRIQLLYIFPWCIRVYFWCDNRYVYFVHCSL